LKFDFSTKSVSLFKDGLLLDEFIEIDILPIYTSEYYLYPGGRNIELDSNQRYIG